MTTTAPSTATDAPDLRAYQAIHVALREGAFAMAAASADLGRSDARRLAAFCRYWKGYRGEVLAHHGAEDGVLFPDLVLRAPEVAGVVVATGTEHQQLDDAIDDVTSILATFQPGDDPTRLVAVLWALADHMDAHLVREDTEVLPVVAAVYDRTSWAEVEERIVDDLGVGAQAAFTIPFLLAAMEPGERADVLASAPLPLRVIHRLFERRHARLVAVALAG